MILRIYCEPTDQQSICHLKTATETVKNEKVLRTMTSNSQDFFVSANSLAFASVEKAAFGISKRKTSRFRVWEVKQSILLKFFKKVNKL